MTKQNKLSKEQQDELLQVLKDRFHEHMHRHEGVEWDAIQEKQEKNEDKLWSLYEMERTGGEPDVVTLGSKTDEVTFVDCAKESPTGRRKLCYDREALDARKKNKPENSAIDVADEMGIELLTEEEYRALQEVGEFDLKTSSWIVTPAEIRKLGGALFGDRRYDHVFIYHNGAQSYYGARRFRGSLTI